MTTLAHRISDVILFNAKNIDDAAQTILTWMRNAEGSKGCRPRALVAIETVCRRDTLTCLLASRVTNFTSRWDCLFSGLAVYGGSGHVPVRALKNEVKEPRRCRLESLSLWDFRTVCDVMRGFVACSRAGQDPRAMGFSVALDIARGDSSVVLRQKDLKRRRASWIKQMNTALLLERQCIPFLASRICLDLTSNKLARLGDDDVQTCYIDIAEKAIQSQTLLPSVAAVKLLRRAMDAHAREHGHGMEVIPYHGAFLASKATFLGRKRSRELCLSCCMQPCNIFFVCGCGICVYCCRASGAQPDRATTRSFDSCPLCRTRFNVSHSLRLPPVATGLRILELDGGGMMGAVQLEVLAKIEEMVGLDIQIVFDMFVGTSVGALNCVFMGRLEWPVSSSRHRFGVIASQCFRPPSALGGMIPQTLVRLVRLLRKDAIYDNAAPVFQNVVGGRPFRGYVPSMLTRSAREQVHVAVSVSDSATGLPQVISTFDRARFDDEKPTEAGYDTILPHNILMRDILAATSAAPVYFPASDLPTGQKVQDHIRIPQMLTKQIAARHHSVFVLSLSCGRYRRPVQMSSSLFLPRLLRSLLMLAQAQYNVDVLKEKAIRVDPDLAAR